MRPFTLLIKPTGPDCNINCEYCFYSGKVEIFGKEKHRMSDLVAETMVRDYLALGFPENSIAWQGGEPTLMGVDFYRRLMEWEKKYVQPRSRVSNALQTNGILLDEEWCTFLHDNDWLVGISLDGPKRLHDFYRKDFSGKGTFDRVMRGIENCKKYNVEFNILTLLNAKNVVEPDTLFDFFMENGFKYLQFIQCVERDEVTGQIAGYAVTAEQYGEFLCRIFDRWLEYGPGKISIRMFDSILNYCLWGRHTICTMSRTCDDYIVIEHNGDAYCCDFFVEGKWRIGNILQTPIGQLASSKMKKQFSKIKSDICMNCTVCRYLDICRGGCVKDRAAKAGLYKDESYFCQSYKKFFDYALPKFWQIAADFKHNE